MESFKSSISLFQFLSIKVFVVVIKLLYFKELLLKQMPLLFTLHNISPSNSNRSDKTTENQQRLLQREACVLGEAVYGQSGLIKHIQIF